MAENIYHQNPPSLLNWEMHPLLQLHAVNFETPVIKLKILLFLSESNLLVLLNHPHWHTTLNQNVISICPKLILWDVNIQHALCLWSTSYAWLSMVDPITDHLNWNNINKARFDISQEINYLMKIDGQVWLLEILKIS